MPRTPIAEPWPQPALPLPPGRHLRPAGSGAAFAAFAPDAVMHLAAESHVDRSIDGRRVHPDQHRRHLRMLEAALALLARPGGRPAGRLPLPPCLDRRGLRLARRRGGSPRARRYDPNSPYSASKAAADHLARAWHRTYGLPVIVTNCSNNYGPYQFPEKLIPLTIIKAAAGEPLPVYGKGENVRDWIHVEDHARGILPR